MTKTQGKTANTVQEEPVKEMKEIKSPGYSPVLIPADSIMNQLVDAETGMEMTTSYRTREEWIDLKDQPIRAFFMGTEDAETGDGSQFTAASFISLDKVFVAGQTVLVEAVRNLPKGQGVQITYTGEKKNKNGGKTQLFSVIRLKSNFYDLQKAAAEAEVVGGEHE